MMMMFMIVIVGNKKYREAKMIVKLFFQDSKDVIS